MKRVLVVGALLVSANAAFAADLVDSARSVTEREQTVGINYPVQSERTGIVVPFDVTGIPSHDALGLPGNTIINFNIAAAAGLPNGTPMVMNGIGWNVNLSAFGGSWLSELRVYFDDNINPDNTGLFLRPGAGSNFPGDNVNFQNGVIKLVDVAIPDIPLPNGILRLDFHESFDDVAGADDGLWKSGQLLIQVTPEPASLALLGLGALALIRRR